MTSTAGTSDNVLAEFIRKYLPSHAPPSANEPSIADLVKSTFPNVEYSDAEKGEISQWISTSHHIANPSEDAAKSSERLSSLNTHLATRTTLLGNKPSLADVAVYARLAPAAAKWSPEERTGEQGYHHIVRHLDFVQNAPLFKLEMSDSDKVSINVDEVLSPIKPVDAKAEKERKKKEKEAAAAAGAPNGAGQADTSARGGGRKAKKEAKEAAKGSAAVAGVSTAAATSTPSGANPIPPTTNETQTQTTPSAAEASGSAPPPKPKKEKAPKAPKQPPKVEEKPLSPSLIDLRVGHILKAENHPNADSLYVSTIACGDAPGTDNTSEYEGQVVRTVCSGLNGLVPLEEMQGRKIVAVCNLKPVTMRGIKSAAMVLAASPRLAEGEVDNHKGPVELVNPPEGAKAGDRVAFEGWEEGAPEPVLNPKKKVWETCQVGFTTTDAGEVAFDASAVEQLNGKTGVSKLKTNGGVCTVKSLKGATVR